MPDFRGKTVAEATTEANAMSLGVTQAGTAASDTYAEGQIISQDPEAGTQVDENTTIRVTVSSGPEITMVNVPHRPCGSLPERGGSGDYGCRPAGKRGAGIQ